MVAGWLAGYMRMPQYRNVYCYTFLFLTVTGCSQIYGAEEEDEEEKEEKVGEM